jgi:hypothetical protein
MILGLLVVVVVFVGITVAMSVLLSFRDRLFLCYAPINDLDFDRAQRAGSVFGRNQTTKIYIQIDFELDFSIDYSWLFVGVYRTICL